VIDRRFTEALITLRCVGRRQAKASPRESRRRNEADTRGKKLKESLGLPVQSRHCRRANAASLAGFLFRQPRLATHHRPRVIGTPVELFRSPVSVSLEMIETRKPSRASRLRNRFSGHDASAAALFGAPGGLAGAGCVTSRCRPKSATGT